MERRQKVGGYPPEVQHLRAFPIVEDVLEDAFRAPAWHNRLRPIQKVVWTPYQYKD